MEQAQTIQRILVSDFDSVHQAQTWRSLGARDATTQLTSVLRTAVLLGDVLVVDRNQLLDGIFFLAMGPEGIAHALGLMSTDPLPLIVRCQGGTLDENDRRVPLHRGLEKEFYGDVSVDFQLHQVRSAGFREAASALMATRGHIATNAWLCGPAGNRWVRGGGLTHFDDAMIDDDQIIELIEHSQDEWADAIASGRVAVDRWDRHGEGSVLDVVGSLARIRERITTEGEQVRPLGDFVLHHTSTFRRVVTNDVKEWCENPENKGDLDEGRLAMEMWSQAYYQAIAQHEGCLYLSFFDGIEDGPLQRAYGLTLAPRSRYQRLKDRAFTSRYGATIRVEGEILDRMLVISPANFAQLYLLTRHTAARLIEKQQASAMYDLAYAAREAVNEPDSHATKRRQTIRRMTITMALLFAVTILSLMGDLADMSSGQQVLVFVVAAVLGVVAGMPWGDIQESLRLRTSSMTATLTLSNKE